jgi:hypothetical protein
MDAICITQNGERITSRRDCSTCGHTTPVYLVRNITGNGASQIFWQCIKHDGAIDSPIKYIAHDKIKSENIDINKIPILNNYSLNHVCSVCGTVGAALHHFAPRYIFKDECEKWAKGYLCESCHKKWHDLVTPRMREK